MEDLNAIYMQGHAVNHDEGLIRVYNAGVKAGLEQANPQPQHDPVFPLKPTPEPAAAADVPPSTETST